MEVYQFFDALFISSEQGEGKTIEAMYIYINCQVYSVLVLHSVTESPYHTWFVLLIQASKYSDRKKKTSNIFKDDVNFDVGTEYVHARVRG